MCEDLGLIPSWGGCFKKGNEFRDVSVRNQHGDHKSDSQQHPPFRGRLLSERIFSQTSLQSLYTACLSWEGQGQTVAPDTMCCYCYPLQGLLWSLHLLNHGHTAADTMVGRLETLHGKEGADGTRSGKPQQVYEAPTGPEATFTG